MHHWRYGVEYVERLSHWPYWLNRSHAYISVKRIVTETGPEQLAIESEHQTCFLRGLYCRMFFVYNYLCYHFPIRTYQFRWHLQQLTPWAHLRLWRTDRIRCAAR